MSVLSLFLNTQRGGPMVEAAEARAVAGRGLDGNRYYRGVDGPAEPEDPGADDEATLIEFEAIEAFRRETGLPLGDGESRRNILTVGVRLNDLVGQRFRVGEAVLIGRRLCHPCSRLEKLTRPGVLRGLVNRGGLRAAIVEGGTIRPGDAVTLLDSVAAVGATR